MVEANLEENIKSASIFSEVSKMGHEQVVFCHDEPTGLKAIIGIHNTILGPALGGTRMWNYASEEEAVIDVLRLSRGMTYKAAISGLNPFSCLIAQTQQGLGEFYDRVRIPITAIGRCIASG